MWHEAKGGKCPQGVGKILTVAGVQGRHSEAGSVCQQVSGGAASQLGKGPQCKSQVLLVELMQDAVYMAGRSSQNFITCNAI